MILPVKFALNDHIEVACREAKALATTLKCAVSFDFNGMPISVNAHSDLDEVVRVYRRDAFQDTQI